MDCVTDLAFMSDPACLFGKGNLFLGEPCACCKGVHLWNFQTFVISLLRSFFVPSTFFSPLEMPPKRVQAGYFRGLKMGSNFGWQNGLVNWGLPCFDPQAGAVDI